jgi:uncharacterized membrane protein YidH (DUF202 family)
MTKSNRKLIGLILLIVGVVLILWGVQMYGSFGSGISRAFSGSPTDETIVTFILGAVSLVAGLFLYKK